jgi:hypothetical protein
VALACQSRSLRSDPDLLVGVLEDVPGHYQGEAESRKIRVLFRKSTDAWQPLLNNCPDENCLKGAPSAFPPHVKWTVAHNGKNLGVLDGQTPKTFDFYSDIGLQTIAPAAAIPTVGDKTPAYAGFDAETKYRPLATVSRPSVLDPDGWTSTSLSSETITAVRKSFRAKFPDVQNCVGPDERPQPWRYSDADIQIGWTYTSNKHWTVAGTRLEDRCDGPPEAPFRLQMFAIDPMGRISLVGEEFSFLDAGDYDADGRSEVLCFLSGYNRGGYALLFDDFKRSAIFEFSYH